MPQHVKKAPQPQASPAADTCRPTLKLADDETGQPLVSFPTEETEGVVSSVPPCSDRSPTPDPSCTIPLYPDKTPPAELFQPAWRVDHFTWPKVCRRLIARAAKELDRLADALAAASARGQKVLAIAGYRRGEGATTLLLCAARRLAERGIRLALVDADLTRPRLASRLGVQPQVGWDEGAADEEGSLAQAIVEAAANNMALLPARERPAVNSRPADLSSRLARCVELLRGQYDLVLVDLGPLEDAGLANGRPAWAVPGTINGVVLTHDQRITSEEELIDIERQLAAADVTAVGIVENFVAEG